MPAVILCEKPAQARDLARALGGVIAQGPGWLDCPAARLTWAIGHLVDTASPETYDERYRTWRLTDLPIIPQQWILEPRAGVKDQLSAAVATLRLATVIYIATDAGREGELIAYEIIERAGVNVPLKRLWFSAQDEESLRRAWAHPKDGSETVRLFHAAQTRQRADWLFGMNLSRAATLVFGSRGRDSVLSYGRVQTPTLALVVQRDRTIETFVSREYFELTAHVRSGSHGVTMSHVLADDERIWERAQADVLFAQLVGAEGTLRVQREMKRLAPPRPYALYDLQGHANSRFGYSTQDTLDLAQALYEKHKAITYPRSDCSYLPQEMQKQVPTMLRLLIQTQILPNHPELAKPILRRTIFDNTKLSEHHAIVPTCVRAPIEHMTEGERNVFELIAVRFAQALLPDYEYEATTMCMDTNGIALQACGRVPVRMGWRDLDRTPIEEEQEDSEHRMLPPIRDGSPAKVTSADIISKATQAPPRYTERTLLADMKNVQRLVEDPLLKQKLKETSGLGTEATRASVIETLKKRAFIELGGQGRRSITSTDKGRQLIDSLPLVLTLPGLTAAWEDLLESVAAGTRPREDVLSALTAHMQKQLALVIASKPPSGTTTPLASAQRSAAPTVGTSDPHKPAPAPQALGAEPGESGDDKQPPDCPQCGRAMRWRINRKTQAGFWGCTGYPACTATIDRLKRAGESQHAAFGRPPDCPSCSRHMRLVQGSRGPFFGCTGYPECQTSVDVNSGSSADHLGIGRSQLAAPSRRSGATADQDCSPAHIRSATIPGRRMSHGQEETAPQTFRHENDERGHRIAPGRDASP